MGMSRYLLPLIMIAVFVSAVGPLSTAQDIQRSFDAGAERIKSSKVEERLYRVQKLVQSTALSSEDAWDLYGVKTIADSVQVRVLLKRKVVDSDFAVLVESGGRVQRSHNRSVQMIIPITSLPWFEHQADVAAVCVPNYAIPTEVVSEGLETIGIPPYHNLGFKGQGVRIAILDGGFKDYAQYVGTELPTNMHRIFWGDDFEADSKHGTRCAQIVYDVAPEAEFWLHQFDTEIEFFQILDWISENDIDIISCSMVFFVAGWPDGSSEMSQKIEALKNAGTLWVQSAGNHARQHWRGSFHDPDVDGYHNFSGNDLGNSIYLNSQDKVVVRLFWNDYPLSDQNFDLYLAKSPEGTIVAQSTRVQNGHLEPYETLTYTSTQAADYFIVIARYSSTQNPMLHLYVDIGGGDEMEYVTESRSVLLPGDSRGSLTVGAVDWRTPSFIESYSSRGPTEDARIKPDLVAPDGVTVKEGTGTAVINGTSFACPHVAGAAAVFLSYKPSTVPSTIIDTFKTMCVDLGISGPDNTYGWGLLYLPRVGNSPPILFDPLDKVVAEGSTLDFQLVAYDADGDPLTYSASNMPSGASLSASGRFLWTPSYEQAGTFYVTFTVSDDEASDQETVKITVNNVNRAPTLEEIADVEASEDEVVAFAVYATDPDEDDELQFSATPLPSGATFSTLVGSFFWTPSYEQAGTYEIVFSVTDGEAQDNDTVTIQVSDVNRAPVFEEIQDIEVNENELVSFTVEADDPDSGDDVTLASVSLPSGALFGESTGFFTWTPTFEQSGQHTAQFSATDGEQVNTMTVNITVLNVNRAPLGFSLLSPEDGSVIGMTNPRLEWQPAQDSDADDTVTYSVLLSEGDELSWSETASGLSDTFYVTGGLTEATRYYWKVVARDNWGDSALCTTLFEFFVKDLTPPDFDISVLSNPVLQHELDVYVIPSEPLVSAPLLLLQRSGHSDTSNCTGSSNHYSDLYMADVSLTEDGSYTIEACGTDTSQNEGCSDIDLTAGTISEGSASKIVHLDGQVVLDVQQNSLRSGRRVIITTTASDDILAVTLQPRNLKLLRAATLRIEIPEWFVGQPVVYLEDDGETVPCTMMPDGKAVECRIDRLGTYVLVSGSAVIQDDQVADANAADDFQLRNHPNPFNDNTQISFAIPQSCQVELEIFNLAGQKVRTLLSGFATAGEHAVDWNSQDDAGRTLASGVYIMRLTAGDQTQTAKMLLLK